MNQDRSEHPYQRLLTEFLQAHAKHAYSPFVIELFSVKTSECEREWHPDDFLHTGKLLFTQQTESMWGGPVVVVCATVGSLPALENLRPEAFYDLAKQAWAEFKPLAVEAGAHLPLAITDELPDEPDDPLSQWFAFLYATHPLHDEDLAEALRDRKILLRSPFKASAEVVEQCKLGSDEPILPPMRQALKGQIDATDLKEEDGEAGSDGTGSGSDMCLSSIKQDILRALVEANAVDSDHRQTCDDITLAVAGVEGDPNTFKQPLAEMVHDGFLDSRTGRGGGSWLKQAGIDRAGKQ